MITFCVITLLLHHHYILLHQSLLRIITFCVITLILHYYYVLLHTHYYLLLPYHYYALSTHYYIIITSFLRHFYVIFKFTSLLPMAETGNNELIITYYAFSVFSL